MQYIRMTIEEASKRFGDHGSVLVAVQDLENEMDTIQEFKKKSNYECIKIINDAETIVKICDDFLNQMRVFTQKQPDIINITPKGKMSTILLPEE